MDLQRAATPASADIPRLADQLAAMLLRDGPAVVVCPPGPIETIVASATAAAAAHIDDQAWADLGLALPTSGTTGPPSLVALTRAAVRASAAATDRRLRSHSPDDERPTRWLLALPTRYIAGTQVVVRAVLAGAAPFVMPLTDGFRASVFTASVNAIDDGVRLHTALVPTQLARVLADPDAVAAARRFAAILVGGAAIGQRLLASARAAGLAVVTTYGMSETAGGCVYDGIPLASSRVSLDADGRVLLGGDTLAVGYLDEHGRLDGVRTASAFATHNGTRWFRSSDLGEFTSAGTLRVLGRRDAVINTGGVKVHPGPIEGVLAEHPAVIEAVVFARPDPVWGERVSAVVELADSHGSALATRDLDALKAAVRERLGATHVPQQIEVTASLPRLGTGKVDRRAVIERYGATNEGELP